MYDSRRGATQNKNKNKQTSLPSVSEECRRVDSSFLVFSLSSHRYSYVSLLFTSRFIDSQWNINRRKTAYPRCVGNIFEVYPRRVDSQF